MDTNQTTAEHASLDCAAVRRSVKGLLLKLNFRSKLVGTHYLEEALMIKLLCQKQYVKVMDLYAAIAKYHGTTPSNVERAIRNTIADCHRNKTLQKINEELGCNICDPKYPPTNSDFITEVSIRMQYLSQQTTAHEADFAAHAQQFAKSSKGTHTREATHSQW